MPPNVPMDSRFGAKDDAPGRWERSTWPVLKSIAEDRPEAGLHFLSGSLDYLLGGFN